MHLVTALMLLSACHATRLTLYNHCDFKIAVQKAGTDQKLKHFCSLDIDGNFSGNFNNGTFGLKELFKNLWAAFSFNNNGTDLFYLNAIGGRIGSSMKIVADQGDSIVCTDADCSQAIANPSEYKTKIHRQVTGGKFELHFCPDNVDLFDTSKL